MAMTQQCLARCHHKSSPQISVYVARDDSLFDPWQRPAGTVTSITLLLLLLKIDKSDNHGLTLFRTQQHRPSKCVPTVWPASDYGMSALKLTAAFSYRARHRIWTTIS